MSTPTDLQDLLHRAVRDIPDPDPERLAHDARRRGLGIRRRRQAIGLVGVATVCALVLGGVQVARDLTPAPGGGAAAGQAAELVPATGEMTAAALVQLLDQVDDGSVVHVAGQDGDLDGDAPDVLGDGGVYVEVRWRPADGSGDSIVGLNVEPAVVWEEGRRCTVGVDCDTVWPSAAATVDTRRELSGDDATEVVSVATYVRDDGVRVALTSSNGLLLADGGWEERRPLPALDQRQLRTIAESPVLGLRMDPAYAEPQRLPDDYIDLDTEDPDIWSRLYPTD